MANLQNPPQQSTIASTPAPSAPPPPAPSPVGMTQGDITRSQLTGVNVPAERLSGTPYKFAVENDVAREGDRRLEFYSPKVSEVDAVTNRDQKPLQPISRRDDRAIDRLVMNQQGTTDRDLLSRPDDYHFSSIGHNFVLGGGVNGMSPTAVAENPTPGSKPTGVTPSDGRYSRGFVKTIAEDNSKKPYYGEHGFEGSTAMRANGGALTVDAIIDSTPSGKAKPVHGKVEYPPYTPMEIRNKNVSPANTIAPSSPVKPDAVTPAATPDMERMRALVRRQETGSFEGDYTKKNIGNKTSASGAYQFVDKTWRNAAQAAGVGTEYKHAYQAPKEVQDKVFDHYFGKLMENTKGDFYKAINIHFTGNPEGRLSAAGKKANPTVNAQGYRNSISRHAAEYDKMKSTVATR